VHIATAGKGGPPCTAHRSDGQPCRNLAARGQDVCRFHGGATPQAKAAAEQRTADAEAEKAIAKLWPGLASATPIKDPVDQMERLAGALTQMLDVVGAKVNGIDHYATGTGMAGLRGELTLLDRVTGHLRQLLADMARLGIAERHVELEQERAQLVTAAFRAALLVLADRVTLLPADRDLVIRTFLEQLGTASTVPGEVA
jgi:hypothetical protein